MAETFIFVPQRQKPCLDCSHLLLDNLHARRDLERGTERPVNGAALGVNTVNAFHSVPRGVGFFGAQSVRDVHPPDDEHSFVILYFTAYLATEATCLGIDFARIQRAGKSAEHS